MALQSTTLTAAITASQVQFGVTAAPSSVPAVGAGPLSVGVPMLIDSEFMYVVSQPFTNVVQVRGRGSDGTAASAHDILANVYVSAIPGDFAGPAPQQFTTVPLDADNVISIGQDATITVPAFNTVYNINKATAAAITLAAPSLAANGVLVQFTSQTAAAHVITATTLLADGSSGSPKSTATFVAAKGATVSFVAENGLWNVSALQNVTVA